MKSAGRRVWPLLIGPGALRPIVYGAPRPHTSSRSWGKPGPMGGQVRRKRAASSQRCLLTGRSAVRWTLPRSASRKRRRKRSGPRHDHRLNSKQWFNKEDNMANENDDDVKNPSKKRGGNKDGELAIAHTGGNLSVDCEAQPSDGVSEGGVVTLTATPSLPVSNITWTVEAGFLEEASNRGRTVAGALSVVHWNTTDVTEGSYLATVTVTNAAGATAGCEMNITVRPRPFSRGDVVPVTLRRTATVPTTDLPLWIVIRKTTEAMSFDNYLRF